MTVAGMVYTSIPSPSWSGFTITLPWGWGQVQIHAYALCILLGILACLWLTSKRWQERGAPKGALGDVAIWAIPFGIIGGRLYHVFTTPGPYFGPEGDPGKIFRIWEGGLGIWGAIAFGALGAWIGCRTIKQPFVPLLDAAAPGLLLAQAIGRWGNYFNQELFGAPTNLPWGLEVSPSSPNFPAQYPPDTLFQPTFLYESLWNLAGIFLLLLIDRRYKFIDGRLFCLYVMYYTVGRFWIEALRIDEAQEFNILGMNVRLNNLTSIVVFLGALVAFIWLTIRHRRTEATESPRESSNGDKTAELDGGAEPDGGIEPDDATGLRKASPKPEKNSLAKRTSLRLESEESERGELSSGSKVTENTGKESNTHTKPGEPE